MSEPVPSTAANRLTALMAEALLRARATGRHVLVSVVERVAPVDPLAAVAAVVGQTGAALAGGSQMFWAHPATAHSMAAFGAVVVLEPSGRTRFADADAAWRLLLRDALIDDAGGSVPATGPLLMGGFSFEPNGPYSPTWRDFPSTRLVVPLLLVTTMHGRSWLTSSALVAPDGTTTLDATRLERLRSLIIEAPALAPGAPDESAPELDYDEQRPASDWMALVGSAITAIRGGAMEKVVLARAVEAATDAGVDVIALLDHLRRTHQDSYTFGCWRGNRVFAGASPERLVRLSGRDVDASSLAGSARRGGTREEDDALATSLRGSAKDRAEHAMVRRALVDALTAWCDDVRSDDEPSLLTLPHVHHLHTAVHARLRSGHSLLDLVGALHPTPAVGGAPRAGALKFIHDHEGLDRGWYAAPVGWIGRDAGELAVALRSAMIGDGRATLYAGCGIVADSDPEQELAESRIKLRPMQLALSVSIDAPYAGRAAEGDHGGRSGSR
jgi:isochorismate synthase